LIIRERGVRKERRRRRPNQASKGRSGAKPRAEKAVKTEGGLSLPREESKTRLSGGARREGTCMNVAVGGVRQGGQN